jgi:hypothetical protein
MTRTIWRASSIALWALGVAGAASAGQGLPTGNSQVAQGLHERVAAAGSYLREATDSGDLPAADVAELGGRAFAIVVGRALEARSHLMRDGQNLVTEVAFLVQARMKGPLLAGRLLYLQVPGGLHRFADGRAANQHPDGFRSLQKGATYVLFLRPIRVPTGRAVAAPGGEDALPVRAQYELSAGPQSAFRIDVETGVIEPAATSRTHPLAARYANLAMSDFLSELSRALQR